MNRTLDSVFRGGHRVAAGVALATGLLTGSAFAGSSVASSALDSLSTSVGTSSTAVSGISNSASPGKNKVAQGEYRIARTAALAEDPARTAVDLIPVSRQTPAGEEAASWQLRLPAAVAAAAALEPGVVLAVRDRAYGFGVWRQGEAQPFYLVVQDAWALALQAQPLNPPAR